MLSLLLWGMQTVRNRHAAWPTQEVLMQKTMHTNLLLRNVHRPLVVAFEDELLESNRSAHVAPVTVCGVCAMVRKSKGGKGKPCSNPKKNAAGSLPAALWVASK